MSSNEKRIDRLLPGLTAVERARIMLGDLKRDEPQDYDLLDTAPDAQAPTLNRLIALMNAANGDIAHLIAIVAGRVQQEKLRLGWLDFVRLSGIEMWFVRAYFNMSGREPITESEQRTLQEEAAKAFIPIDECATMLTEEHHVWADADYETTEDGTREPTDEAWYRVRDEKVAHLRALAAAGTLSVKGKGRRMKIDCGSLYAWLGQPVPVAPDFGAEFDVRPDAELSRVKMVRRHHDAIRNLVNRGACHFDLPLDVEGALLTEPPRDDRTLELARVLVLSIRRGVVECSAYLGAIEEQLESMRTEFGGEEPLHPDVRECFDEAKADLVTLHAEIEEYTGSLALPESHADARERLEHAVENEIAHLSVR